MCDFSGKLVAWLDRELPADETSEVERHLEACSACRCDVDTYKRVSSEFDAYCDEAIASHVRRGAPRWVLVVSAAGAVAAGGAAIGAGGAAAVAGGAGGVGTAGLK